ncbi:hypothetical protein EX30DRAFT_352656 [Ascodesmis nigricans]|uniref:Uncharacterized protein n=1 Tax=Ascodesmis nigricans TaxID=341454 RepID=A0A4S2MHP8_9PEZI|nr:hypothetical protein EX30DRAFT_352656 [Ascodesmis nigricans]
MRNRGWLVLITSIITPPVLCFFSRFPLHGLGPDVMRWFTPDFTVYGPEESKTIGGFTECQNPRAEVVSFPRSIDGPLKHRAFAYPVVSHPFVEVFPNLNQLITINVGSKQEPRTMQIPTWIEFRNRDHTVGFTLWDIDQNRMVGDCVEKGDLLFANNFLAPLRTPNMAWMHTKGVNDPSHPNYRVPRERRTGPSQFAGEPHETPPDVNCPPGSALAPVDHLPFIVEPGPERVIVHPHAIYHCITPAELKEKTPGVRRDREDVIRGITDMMRGTERALQDTIITTGQNREHGLLEETRQGIDRNDMSREADRALQDTIITTGQNPEHSLLEKTRRGRVGGDDRGLDMGEDERNIEQLQVVIGPWSVETILCFVFLSVLL